jgi:lysophospholipase L1-like esterase
MHRIVIVLVCLGLVWTSSAFAAIADDKQPVTVVPAPRDGDWLKRHEQINARAKQGDVALIFLGDSITQGWNDNAVWQKYYGSRKAMNAGIGGDQTQHVLWRLDNGNIDGISPKLAVIMIGTNNSGSNTSEDIAAGIKAIVAKLRTKLPHTKILLLGVFPRGDKPDNRQRQVNIGANALAKSVADGKNVFYLDISDRFLEPDGTLSKDIMPDYLHLSEKGYDIWAKSIEPKVAELLGDSPKS